MADAHEGGPQSSALQLTAANPPLALADHWWHSGAPRAFGGQIIAHCIVAAARLAPSGWSCHSCHIHFLRPGRMVDTRYEPVDLRVGRTYATYQVTAVELEGERSVAVAVVSFHDTHSEQAGGAPALHAALMPPVTEANRPSRSDRSSPIWPGYTPLDDSALLWQVSWCSGALQTQTDQVAALGFLSDMRFIWAAHATHRATHDVTMVASLDHTIYFHATSFDASAPLVYQMDSPWAAAGRGLVRGRLWERGTGRLIASTVQEGVLRVSVPGSAIPQARL